MIRAKERVYVVRRRDLFAEDAPRGFVPGTGSWLETVYAKGFFAERDAVEEDPSLKQVIPYAVIERAGGIFCFRRSNRGGEKRLFGLRSIGVGGHVNPEDGDDVVRDALHRELDEELLMPAGWTYRLAGLLNDDTTPVGSVHVGVVAVVDPGPGEVSVRERDMMSGAFARAGDLLELHATERESFESWSALLLNSIEEVIGCPVPEGSSSTTANATRISST